MGILGTMTVDPLTCSIRLELSVEDAFALFVDRFGQWWPSGFSWSGTDLLDRVTIASEVGGPLSEYSRTGLRWDFGMVKSISRPDNLTFSWQIGPDRVPVADPARASEVHVQFFADDGSTTVTVRHDGWERHGEAGSQYRDDFSQAWPMILERLQRTA